MSLVFALHPGPSPAHAAVSDTTIAAARLGDEVAFAALYDAYAPRVYALCLGLSGTREGAAELVQDTFVRAWEALATFRGDASFPTWLHRIAVNAALESRRRGQRRSLRVQIASELAGVRDEDDPRLDGESRAHDAGLAMDLEAAILRLPSGARAVFVLHDVEGYGHAEIGERLGIAEGTSRAHLFRARRLMREMLER